MFVDGMLVSKLVLGIIFLIIYINIFGKNNLSPTSPMDQVQNYVLGALVGGVIYNSDITVLDFFLVLVAWTLLCMVLKVLKEHTGFFKRLVDGAPVSLITKGKIDVASCMKNGVSANDLMLKLRAQGVYEVSKVRKAYFEQNGQLTVISYDEDMMRLPVITDGRVEHDALEATGHDEQWLEDQIKARGYKTSAVYLAEYDAGELRLTVYEG